MQNSNDIDKLIAESQSRFGKKTFYIFGTIIFFITAIIFSYFYFNSDSDAEIISYELHNMTTGSIANTLIASGSTQIDKKISLSFGTSGNLSKIFVEEGESVIAGQILAELDPVDLENALERQEIALKNLLELGHTKTHVQLKNRSNGNF